MSLSSSASEPASATAPSQEAARWFANEVQPHDGQLKAYLRSAYPSVRDIDDVVQESYLRIWRRQAERPIKSVKAFLFTIARRLAIDVVRHDARSPFDSVGDLKALDVYDDGAHVAESVCRAEKIRLLTEAIDALPRRCREVVILRKFELLSTKEVAAQLGITEHAVENQFTRGLARIRERLHARGIRHVLGHEP